MKKAIVTKVLRLVHYHQVATFDTEILKVLLYKPMIDTIVIIVIFYILFKV